jgi:nitroimidazol reductase NimA-like FMN-containing flavoprotein (pyridoxamine 5'-phosphate oxidase superfamily)
MSGWATDHAGLSVLTGQECTALLTTGKIGRVAFSADGEIEIFPVTYFVDGASVLFRSGVGTKLSAALEQSAVAFEIDGFDVTQRHGWSVVVRGTCEEVQDTATLSRLEATGFRSWIETTQTAERFRWIRIRPYSITGRQIPHGK